MHSSYLSRLHWSRNWESIKIRDMGNDHEVHDRNRCGLPVLSGDKVKIFAFGTQNIFNCVHYWPRQTLLFEKSIFFKLRIRSIAAMEKKKLSCYASAEIEQVRKYVLYLSGMYTPQYSSREWRQDRSWSTN